MVDTQDDTVTLAKTGLSFVQCFLTPTSTLTLTQPQPCAPCKVDVGGTPKSSCWCQLNLDRHELHCNLADHFIFQHVQGASGIGAGEAEGAPVLLHTWEGVSTGDG